MTTSRCFISVLVTLLPFVGPSVASAAGPSISVVSYPSGVTANAATTLSVGVSSPATITSCNLYVDSEDRGSMTLTTGTASRSHTFPRGGVFTLFVFCKDSAGGKASGPNTSIFVEGPIVVQPTYGGSQPTTPTEPTTSSAPTSTPSGPVHGNLVKLECPADAGPDHACKAVYYYGRDGKRHAFPNSKVYFTWYADFTSVVTVTPEALSAIPLGKNVTYRPGSRMVKFQTLNNVYAVTRHGVLRWVKDESAAATLYGTDWNTKIDDIADVFYTNYAYGSEIATSGDYSVTTELAGAATIDDSL